MPSVFLRRCKTLDSVMESGVWAAFITSIALSFGGWLGNPLLYTAVFSLLAFGCYRLTATAPCSIPQRIDDRWIRTALYITIGAIVLIALFSVPGSADGQRIKLARMAIAVNEGSLWATAAVDRLSTMYIFPSGFYTVFAAIEALHLPKQAYSIINTLLVAASAISLWRVFSPKFGQAALLPILLVVLSPQLVFAAIEEHEEALSFFLACRMLVWMVEQPVGFKSALMGVAAAGLAIWAKPSAIVFVPPALVLCAYAVHGISGVTRWLKPRAIAYGLASCALVAPLLLLPDAMTNQSLGTTFAEKTAKLASYHARTPLDCTLPHFFLRLFELFIDGPRMLLSMLHVDVSAALPVVELLPKHCKVEDVFLPFYFMPTAPTRETLQFGFLPLFGVIAVFAARANVKRIAGFAVLLVLTCTLVYALKFSYWWGTGRYFIAMLLILLPALLVWFQSPMSKRSLRIIVLLGLLPAAFIVSREIEVVPRTLMRGDHMNYRAGELMHELEKLDGKVNIYFNDLMPFYTLLRAIPSSEVTLKKEIIQGVQNIVGIPTRFSPSANWHDSYWLVPMPHPEGAFRFVGPVRKNFGNSVPSQFYIGDPATISTDAERYKIMVYEKTTPPAAWAKAHGFSIESLGKRQFITTKGSEKGLCVEHSPDSLFWATLTKAECTVP